MKRRNFVTIIGAAAVLWPHAASAQLAGRQYRIAMLASEPTQFFVEELDRAGFVIGRNLEIDSRAVGVSPAAFEKLATEVVKARPDVLVAFGPDAIRAAQKSTQHIPIQALADDLLGSKLVASMPHPEGNTTGVAIFAYQLDVKRLELLHEALPKAQRIALLADHEPIRNIDALQNAARALGVEIVQFTARSEDDVIRTIEIMERKEIEAVNVLASPILWRFRQLIVDRLRTQRIPTIWQWPEGAEAGGLIAYGPRLPEVFRQCARQVVRLLLGAKVKDVPVEQPTKFDFVINMKTAKALGLSVSTSLLLRADEVIE
jgi:putative tryptophan/tyrosine transport system substrate-binding protein